MINLLNLISKEKNTNIIYVILSYLDSRKHINKKYKILYFLNYLIEYHSSITYNYLNWTSTYSNLIYLNCSSISRFDNPNYPKLILNNTLSNLKYLNCNNTNISYISPDLLDLQILYIQNTNISELPNTLIKLEELYCNYSYIKTLSSNYKNLKILKGDHTFLQYLNIYNLLEYLDCSYNTINDINLIPFNTITNNLKILICNNTLINTLIKENEYFNYMNNFSNLLYLNCSNTNIQYLPPNLNNLIYLNISNTLIKIISTRNLLKLEILICYNCPLYKLNSSMTNLKILNINNNMYITKIPNTFINLEFLMMNNTLKIKKLSQKFIKLKYLSCVNSSLQCLPITLHKLFYLNIANTNIIRLDNKKLNFYYF